MSYHGLIPDFSYTPFTVFENVPLHGVITVSPQEWLSKEGSGLKCFYGSTHKENFYKWLNQARIFLGNAQQYSEHQDIAAAVNDSFGDALIDEALGDFETPHLPVLKDEYLPALYHAEYKENPIWNFDIQGKVKIAAWCYLDNKKKKLPSNWKKLPKETSLRFKAMVRKVSQPYKIYWQVVNTGEEAREKNNLRGGFDDEETRLKEGSRVWPESAEFFGSHSIECYIVKDGVCVAHSDVLIVNVSDQ